MLLVYASRTNNIARIVQKLNIFNTLEIQNGDEKISQNFILLTYTDGAGEIPDVVRKFLVDNKSFLRGVVGSGNRNFGENFCRAAKKISNIFNVQLIAEIELAGCKNDIYSLREKFLSFGGY